MVLGIYEESEERLLIYYNRYKKIYKITYNIRESDMIITNKYHENFQDKICFIPSICQKNSQGNIIYFQDLKELDHILYAAFLRIPQEKVLLLSDKYSPLNLTNTDSWLYFTDIKNIRFSDINKKYILLLILNEICTSLSKIKVSLQNILYITVKNCCADSLFFLNKYAENIFISQDCITFSL